MNKLREIPTATIRAAIYTRKSTEDGLEQEFNSLDAQRESGEAFIKSQAALGWTCLPERYDDGGFSGGSLERPALRRLLNDIEAGRVDCVAVYKVDRLSRSLTDFARLMEAFEKHRVSFVSVTQQINSANSMGRLMLNVLLSFAQFERELVSERTRDKIAAARRKGKWVGGMPLLGFDVVDSKLVVNPDEAEQVRQIFALYVEHEGLIPVVAELERRGWRNKAWVTKAGTKRGGRLFDKGTVWNLLRNVAYIGQVGYKDEVHDGEHEAIVDHDLWQKVQAKLQKNGRTGGAAVRNQFGAILKGLLHCGSCGCSMIPSHTTKGKKRYRYYVCTSAQKQGWKNCATKSLPAGEIEKFVVSQISCIGRDPGLVAETVKQANATLGQRTQELETESRRLKRELGAHNAELRGLVVKGAEGIDTARLADLNERIAATERRLAEVADEAERLAREQIDQADVAKALAGFDPVWEQLTLKEQAKLLQLLIHRIEYDGREGEISITFHPSGIKTLAEQQVEAA